MITLRGVTEATARALGPLKLHASISHEVNYACAVVLAEK